MGSLIAEKPVTAPNRFLQNGRPVALVSGRPARNGRAGRSGPALLRGQATGGAPGSTRLPPAIPRAKNRARHALSGGGQIMRLHFEKFDARRSRWISVIDQDT